MFNGGLAPNAHQQSQLPSLGDLQNGLPSPSSGDDAQKAAQLANALAEPSKNESRPQATFLTKLYALLERPENHHMIRWDAAGEHIIVERPEQLALHVLPSVYRQSRFASFSRQLNIYGFMRKVNLRNIDSTIDDPDASTWSHPTLRRNSPADVIANFKRRVPPRLPKPRKRPEEAALTSGAPRAAGRARGFSAPGSYTQPQPTWQSATPFGQAHARQALPPLAPLSTSSDMPMYPSGPHSSTYIQSPAGNGLHHNDPHSPHHLTPGGYSAHPQGYGSQTRDSSIFLPGPHGSSQGSGYPYHQDPGAHPSHSNWSFLPPLQTGNASGPLSSLVSPSTALRNGIQKQHSYPTLSAHGNAASVSPDSRPTTGYSVASSSMSIPYDELNGEYRPRSSAGRPMTPTAMNSGRPGSSHGRPSSAIGPGPAPPPPPSSLRIGRARRHSQAVSPYPAPFYDMSNDGRPVTAPDNASIHRVRSFGGMPPVDSIGDGADGQNNGGVGQAPFMGFNGSHAEFAYNAGASGPNASMDSIESSWMNNSSQQSHGPGGGNNGPNTVGQPRPNTAASSMSAHSSTSATRTPPIMDTSYGTHDNDLNRFSPDFNIFKRPRSSLSNMLQGSSVKA